MTTQYQYPQYPQYATAATPQEATPVQQVPAPSTTVLGLDVKSSTFWTGAAVGAGLALLVTNESVQKGVVKTFSKMMAAVGGGIEEIKEKYEDAKAEVEAEATGK